MHVLLRGPCPCAAVQTDATAAEALILTASDGSKVYRKTGAGTPYSTTPVVQARPQEASIPPQNGIMSAAIPRFLLPGLNIPCKQNPRLLTFAVTHRGFQCRNTATNSNSSKPRVLEKPTKFYPPSHPQRLAKRSLPRQYPGPPLSQAQQEEQKTKKYPHMMPAEGTVMFWFLNSRMLHMGICLVNPTLSINDKCSTCSLLTSLFSPCYSPSPSSSSSRISTAPRHSWTNYHQGKNSGRILSNSSGRTDRSTKCTRTTSAPRRPNGERRKSTTCKNGAATGRLTAWRMNKGWVGGLRRTMRILWVLLSRRETCRGMMLHPKHLAINGPMLILRGEDVRSKGGWVFGSD